MATVLEVRLALVDHGQTPIPLIGKRPPFDKWEQVANVTRKMLEAWGHNFPRASNTGILTRLTPTIDIDILNEMAAEAAEELVRERFEERGYLLVRIGRAPKRAIPFRTDTPFKKLTTSFQVAPGADAEKLEFLADGQQVVAFGIHPDTQKPYGWFGGDLTTISHSNLPFISAEEARTLQDDLTNLLVRDFGYVLIPGRARAKGNGTPADRTDDWQALIDGILAGTDLHANTRDLAAKMVRAGTDGGAVVNFLRGLMDSSAAPRDQRFEDRYDDLPRLVDSFEAKLEAEAAAAAAGSAGSSAGAPSPAAPSPAPSSPVVGPPPAAPGSGSSGSPPPPPPAAPVIAPAPAAAPGPASSSPLEGCLQTFERWLHLPNRRPLYAMLGTVAANLLPGDPVWLGLVAPPSSAKTELVNALTGLPFAVAASTLTLASLLSGTPQRQRAQGATGGLLRQVSNPGLLVLKDFTSTLTMRPESKAEVLSALREIYDGKWTRYLGTDGGRPLHWEGKLGLIFGCTGAIDTQHSVGDALGNRFLLLRLEPGDNQFEWALKHTGVLFDIMRRELVASVTALFAVPRPDPRPLDKGSSEFRRLNRIVRLVVRLRGATERDRYSRDLQYVYGAEGTGRIGLALERLLAGLDTLGVSRRIALGVVMRVALDSTPPVRRRIYQLLLKQPAGTARNAPLRKWTTTEVGNKLGLPTSTARRNLEDLASYGLVREEAQGKGKASLWQAVILT